MTTESRLLVEKADGVAVLTLNRPEALNALDSSLLRELRARLHRLADDPEVRVVILTGAGDRAFSAGADVREMRGKDPWQAREFSRLGHEVTLAIERMDKPVIAAINGVALGGGCELAIACDIRVAADSARLGQPEVGLGILPGWGATQRLPRLVGLGRARELIYTGRIVTAQEAYNIGLVDSVVSASGLQEECRKLAATIVQKAPLAVAFSKRAINYGMDAGMVAGLALEADLFGLCFASADQKEGMGAFLEKRAPRFEGR